MSLIPLNRITAALATLALLPALIAQEQERPTEIQQYSIGERWEPILLPVSISGINGRFLLDSGASIHVLDSRYKTTLGDVVESVPAGTAGTPVQLDLYTSPKIFVGNALERSERPVSVIDFAKISQVVGVDVHGVLGVSFFRDRVIMIDFDRRIMKVQSGLPPTQMGTVLPCTTDGSGRPYIDALIGDQKQSMMIDTGFNNTLSVTRKQFQRLLTQDAIVELRIVNAETAAGKTSRRSGRLRLPFRVGPFEHHNVSIKESSSNAIGLSYLARYRVIFDISRRQVCLSRGRLYSEREATDASGLHLLWLDERIVVETVEKGSPSHTAGIADGDVILGVNDIVAASIGDLRRLFRGESGTPITIKLKRGQKTLERRFQLREYAQWHPD